MKGLNRARTILFSLMLCLSSKVSFGGISPSKLEVNLGSFPVDQYSDSVMNNGIFPSTNGVCPSNISVRECVRRFFNNDPAKGTVVSGNYVSQGVTGVRFFFALGGGGGNPGGTSTPFTGPNHAVSTTWINNLGLFFNDLKLWGIQRVTPLPALDATWGGGLVTNRSAPYAANPGCPTGNITLNFLPWLPYGLNPSNGFPDGQGDPQAYNCRPYTPSDIFWGWGPLLGTNGLIDQVLAKAQVAGLIVPEFDLLNEVNLLDFNVEARIIYDNSTNTAVSQTVGQLMANHGFSSGGATLSAGGHGRPCDPSQAGCVADCGSVYGDSAQIVGASELQAAFGGAKFGKIPYIAWSGTMACDGSCPFCGSPTPGDPNCPNYNPDWAACATAGMITLPGSHPAPTVTDIHATPCLLVSNSNLSCNTSLDVTSTARTFYSDVWAFLSYRGLTGNIVVFGETSSNQTNFNCNLDTPQMTQQNANGYTQSTLFTSDGGNVRLRPWDDSRSANCTTPTLIGAPNGPYAP